MSEQDRIDMLKIKHQELDTEIEKEVEKATPNDLLISALKKQKLRIKDQLAELDAL